MMEWSFSLTAIFTLNRKMDAVLCGAELKAVIGRDFWCHDYESRDVNKSAVIGRTVGGEALDEDFSDHCIAQLLGTTSVTCYRQTYKSYTCRRPCCMLNWCLNCWGRNRLNDSTSWQNITLLLISMLHFQMCNISNFAEISSVGLLSQRSTVPTRLLMSSRPAWKGPVVWIGGKCRHHKWTLQQDGAPAHTAP